MPPSSSLLHGLDSFPGRVFASPKTPHQDWCVCESGRGAETSTNNKKLGPSSSFFSIFALPHAKRLAGGGFDGMEEMSLHQHVNVWVNNLVACFFMVCVARRKTLFSYHEQKKQKKRPKKNYSLSGHVEGRWYAGRTVRKAGPLIDPALVDGCAGEWSRRVVFLIKNNIF